MADRSDGHRALREKATNAQVKANEVGYDVKLLELRLEKARLVSAAMWEILKERCGATDEELTAKIQELDARDGRVDGSPPELAARACPKCGRVLSKRLEKCLYCS